MVKTGLRFQLDEAEDEMMDKLGDVILAGDDLGIAFSEPNIGRAMDKVIPAFIERRNGNSTSWTSFSNFSEEEWIGWYRRTVDEMPVESNEK